MPNTAESNIPNTQAAGFSIGSVRVDRPFVLAPMSGVTDSPFRRMVQTASTGGVGLLVTEFISIEGLTRMNMKAATRMSFSATDEQPLSIQVFGGEIERMALAARMVEDAGAQLFDINCGCPAPKVVRKGGGAELLRQCDQLVRLVEDSVAAVRIPVTVKIRSGWGADCVNAVEVARRVESAGAAMVAVHGRTRMQMYTGESDWTLIDEVARSVSVPVIGSGDVMTPEEALHRLHSTAVSGVMIGRAAIMNPWIFGQIDDLARGLPARVVTSRDRLRLLHDFRDLMGTFMPDRVIPGRLKQLLARMTKGFAHGSLLREKALRAQSTADMFFWIEGFFAAVDTDDIECWAAEARADKAQVAVLALAC